jgi:hypothetical protein
MRAFEYPVMIIDEWMGEFTQVDLAVQLRQVMEVQQGPTTAYHILYSIPVHYPISPWVKVRQESGTW